MLSKATYFSTSETIMEPPDYLIYLFASTGVEFFLLSNAQFWKVLHKIKNDWHKDEKRKLGKSKC